MSIKKRDDELKSELVGGDANSLCYATNLYTII